MSFFQRIEQRAKEINSLLCIGLDPHDVDPEVQKVKPYLDIGYAVGLSRWAAKIVHETKDLAVCYKINAAFFEAHGAAGVWALQDLIQVIKARGVPVILDCKRADIGSTAAYLAKALFEYMDADCITVLPYLGFDILEDLLPEGKAAFVVCKTTNEVYRHCPFQTRRGLGGFEPYLYEEVALAVKEMRKKYYHELGLVVGAQDREALELIREHDPDAWFLTPGVGAQGGDLKNALKAGLQKDGLGMLLSVSRGITHHKQSPRERTEYYTEAIRSARGC